MLRKNVEVYVARPLQLVERNDLLKEVHKRLNEDAFAIFLKPPSAFVHLEKFAEHDLVAAKAPDHPIGPGAEGLYAVIGQYRPVVLIAVQDADCRIKSCLDQRRVQAAVQNALVISSAGCLLRRSKRY